MRVLWLARELPFPIDSGDRIYTASLARALASTGVRVRVLGHAPKPGTVFPVDDPVEWRTVPGDRRGRLAALASPLPVFAAIHATAGYRAALRAELEAPWDAVVLDQLGSGWALEVCRAAREGPGRRVPIVHIAHNDETAIWRALATHAEGGLAGRLTVRLNAGRVARLERAVLARADLVTAITSEDASAFAARMPGLRTLVLTPGFQGPPAEPRTIDRSTPRRVLLMGSYGWVVKQENLRRFLAAADPVFAAAGIGLDVVGRMPDPLHATLAPGLRATTLHGFVQDVAPLLRRARIAVVPELIGGGFKLKLLDYVFGRIPVATLAAAAAGLDPNLRARMLCSRDLESLVSGVVETIDRVERLDQMQREAFELAQSGFRWGDRGAALRGAIEASGRG
jgi:glycosyltransferase involved in cell wall biosynthesis